MAELQKCVFKESHEPYFVAIKIGGNSFDIQLFVRIIVLDIQRDDHTLFCGFTMSQTHSRPGKVKKCWIFENHDWGSWESSKSVFLRRAMSHVLWP